MPRSSRSEGWNQSPLTTHQPTNPPPTNSPLTCGATFYFGHLAVEPLLFLAGGYVLLMLIAIIFDAWRAPRPTLFEVKRDNDTKLSFGADHATIFIKIIALPARLRLPADG